MWVETAEGLFVNLKQVCSIRKNSPGSHCWYEFQLSTGEVVRSRIFGSREEAESWFRDEVLPFLIRERRKKSGRGGVR